MRRTYPRAGTETPGGGCRWPDGVTTRSSTRSARSSTRTGWTPVAVTEATDGDSVTVEKDGEQRTFRSDHIAFHRFVEGVKEDFGL